MTFPTSFPVLLLLAGLILLLIGLLGKIKIKDLELGTESRPIRVVSSAIGFAFLLAAFLVYQSDKPIRSDNSNSVNINTQPTPTVSSTATPPPIPGPTPLLPKPDTLIEIILREQRNNVKESYGELAGQNFSDKDLANFIKAKTVTGITDRLKTDGEFLEVVLAIKRVAASDRQKLLNKAQSTFKPTWAERGTVDRAGQTDAGQKAERMIAEGIVNLVKELSKLSDDEIKKLQDS